MSVLDNARYLRQLEETAALPLPWEKLQGRSLLLSGATGLIGSFLVDVLMEKNSQGLDCTVYALGRSEEKAKARFAKWLGDAHLRFVPYDSGRPFVRDDLGQIDYILHLASNTHPLQYATDPIGTITTNIIGLQNMLDFACVHQARRFAFASSVEIYGENRGDAEKFDEGYCGYLDCCTLRAGYPESKRCGEALCQAYIRQRGLDIVIPRFARVYGPTMLMSDTKALSQFLRKALAGEDIVLKSAGTQYYSYLYVADAVSGLLTVLLKGSCGEAYNVADEASDIRLKDLAAQIAAFAGRKVVFELPDATEAAGYSKATVARLDAAKLNALGWKAAYPIASGVRCTLSVLAEEK